MAVTPKEYDADFDFDETHWLELVHVMKPGGPGGFSRTRAEDVLVGQIDTWRLPAAVRYFIGYSYTDDVAKSIVRIPPVRHPVFPYLWCDGVTFQPGYVSGNSEMPNNWPAVYTNPEFSYTFEKYGFYRKTEVTLHFGMPLYWIAGDDEMDGYQEYHRYTYYFDTKPNLQIDAVESDRLEFCEGPYSGQKVQSALAVRKSITNFTLKWYQVPYDYLSESGVGLDQIIGTGSVASRVGCVNDSAAFDDVFPAGTLYLDNPVIDWYIQPVETEDGSRLWAADIELPFMHFDPPRYGGSVARGWNLHPHLSGTETARWYLATADGTVSGPRLLPSTDLMSVFNHWNDV